jgi:hypothetical protein
MVEMKRGYYAYNDDDDQGCLAIVASSAKEAKKIAWKSGEIIYGDTGWLAIHVKWVRDAVVSDLPVGIVHDTRDALLRGLYYGIKEYPCDECGNDSDVKCHNGRALCDECIEHDK